MLIILLVRIAIIATFFLLIIDGIIVLVWLNHLDKRVEKLETRPDRLGHTVDPNNSNR